MYGTYRRIETFADVPPPGLLNLTAREHHRLDFKETVAPKTPWEYAKDIATLANTFGGVILIGARDKGGVLEHKGIAPSLASELKEQYEQAAKDHCSPPVIIDVIPIPVPSSTSDLVFLAVNVEPTTECPAGARPQTRDRNGNPILDQTAWVFPVREASQTKYLTPNELPMYMNPKVRRTLLFLDRVPHDGSVRLLTQPHRSGQGSLTGAPMMGYQAKKKTVSLEKNHAQFLLEKSERLPNLTAVTLVNIPLTEIDDLWMDVNGTWNIRALGIIEGPERSEQARYASVVR